MRRASEHLGARVRVPMEAWNEHHNRLARDIRDGEEWKTIAQSMAALTYLNESVTAKMAERSSSELPTGVDLSIQDVRKLVIQAAEILRRVAEQPYG